MIRRQVIDHTGAAKCVTGHHKQTVGYLWHMTADSQYHIFPCLKSRVNPEQHV